MDEQNGDERTAAQDESRSKETRHSNHRASRLNITINDCETAELNYGQNKGRRVFNWNGFFNLHELAWKQWLVDFSRSFNYSRNSSKHSRPPRHYQPQQPTTMAKLPLNYHLNNHIKVRTRDQQESTEVHQPHHLITQQHNSTITMMTSICNYVPLSWL